MRVILDLPPDLEQLIVKKCKEIDKSPSEFIISLIEWYFFKEQEDIEILAGLREFLNVAKELAEERVKNCKYSDGLYCALEVLDDIFSEDEAKPINPFKCLFCPHYIDKESKIKIEGKEVESLEFKIQDVAKLAAKFVVELYGDKLAEVYGSKLGYRANIGPEKKDEKPAKFSGENIKKLMDW